MSARAADSPDPDDLLAQLVEIFKALADPTRLRALGAVVERPRTGTELAELLGVGAPTVSHHMAKLDAAGLVTVERRGQTRSYRFEPGALERLARLSSSRPSRPSSAGSSERDKVMRDFFDGPRLRQIPAQRKKRVIVLQQLLRRFDPRREYAEKEVNAILREAHEDFATLRRELCDYGFMTRARGIYRVAREVPPRSPQIAQEIEGDEQAWLEQLLRAGGAVRK